MTNRAESPKGAKNPVWNWTHAIAITKVPPPTKLVCLNIARYLSDAGRGWRISVEQMMADTGLSNTSIAKHLQNAVDAGLLIIQRTPGPKGQRGVTMYKPRFPDGVERAREPMEMPGEPPPPGVSEPREPASRGPREVGSLRTQPPREAGSRQEPFHKEEAFHKKETSQKKDPPPTPSAPGPGVAFGAAGAEEGIDDFFPDDPTPAKGTAARVRQRRNALTKEQETARRSEAERAFEIYNEAAEQFGFQLAKAATEQRLKRLEQRLEDIGGGVEMFRKALWAIEKDDFLMGRVAKPGQTPFVLTFDRLISTDSGLGDVLARLIDLIDAPPPGTKRRGKQTDLKPDWWHGKEWVMDELPLSFFREIIGRYANGSWPVELLGPGPWQPDKCFIPRKLIEELGLREKYLAPDEGRCSS